MAESLSSSTATSYYGTAISDSLAESSGWLGGRAVSVSESLADAYGGVATSRVRAISDAGYYGSAHSDGIGVSVSGPYRNSRASVHAVSGAYHRGRSRTRLAAIEIRP
jgi:hypothetical protein